MKKLFITLLLVVAFVQIMPLQATVQVKHSGSEIAAKVLEQNGLSSAFLNMTPDEFL